MSSNDDFKRKFPLAPWQALQSFPIFAGAVFLLLRWGNPGTLKEMAPLQDPLSAREALYETNRWLSPWVIRPFGLLALFGRHPSPTGGR
jgi:hypothetical protein